MTDAQEIAVRITTALIDARGRLMATTTPRGTKELTAKGDAGLSPSAAVDCYQEVLLLLTARKPRKVHADC